VTLLPAKRDGRPRSRPSVTPGRGKRRLRPLGSPLDCLVARADADLDLARFRLLGLPHVDLEYTVLVPREAARLNPTWGVNRRTYGDDPSPRPSEPRDCQIQREAASPGGLFFARAKPRCTARRWRSSAVGNAPFQQGLPLRWLSNRSKAGVRHYWFSWTQTA
jgi:hypothetical protein